jgi:hypothetical protein
MNSKYRKLKTIKEILNLVYPYLISTSCAFGIVSTAGYGLPFALDNKKIYEEKKAIIDSRNPVIIDNSNDIYYEDRILVYGSWYEGENKKYEREVKVYLPFKINFDVAYDFIYNKNQDVEKYLGVPNIIKEEKDSLDDGDVINDPNYQHITAYITEIDDNYVVEKETTKENIIITISDLLLAASMGVIVYYIRKNLYGYSFKKQIGNKI